MRPPCSYTASTGRKRGLRMAHRWHTAHGEAFPILRCAIPYFGKRFRAPSPQPPRRPSRLHGGEQIFARLVVETVRRFVNVRVERTQSLCSVHTTHPRRLLRRGNHCGTPLTATLP